jgi:cyclic beta-1,2-glucan synthetase
MLNPINHARDRDQADIYRVEPYVVAADIYGEGQLTGRGGWTWYTGSAGWLYRVAVEGILGIRVKNGRLFVKPALPSNWDGFAADIELPSGNYRISVSKAPDAAGYSVTINDRAVAHPEEGYPVEQ